MRRHRLSLAHAQANVARLLEAVIDAGDELELDEVEGDTVFFSREAGDDAAAVATEAALAMHRAFHEEQRRFFDLAQVAGEPSPSSESLPGRIGETVRVLGGGLPYLLGLKRQLPA
jgi:hypothetical protein